METSFDIIEADFQQYYNINLGELLAGGFSRFTRLLINLPLESRFIKEKSPFGDWDWDKETNARILQMLDAITCQLYNMSKKKHAKARKVGELFQPENVKKAKEECGVKKAKKISESELEEMKAFWESRNAKTKGIENVKNILGK